ncbi:hypothetical protein B0H12DRAFT_1103267 [Mycena haematopus]|nr:hypothetical protein B0H12DRAFT_1103267 [Mycena haematopus]
MEFSYSYHILASTNTDFQVMQHGESDAPETWDDADPLYELEYLDEAPSLHPLEDDDIDRQIMRLAYTVLSAPNTFIVSTPGTGLHQSLYTAVIPSVPLNSNVSAAKKSPPTSGSLPRSSAPEPGARPFGCVFQALGLRYSGFVRHARVRRSGGRVEASSITAREKGRR